MTTMPMLQDFPFQSRDKLRYGDTDKLGHVNNAVFSTFLETGRVEMLYRPDSPLLSEGADFVIANLNIDYVNEITFPGEVEIGTRLTKLGTSSLGMEQVIFQHGQCVARAQTVIVQMDKTTRRSKPFSPEARAMLEGVITRG
jgi:acyl-CoA thioester hydrolase